MNEVKEFYSRLQFPGTYTIEDLKFYDSTVCNDYLKIFDDAVSQSSSVLDIGCGSGFIINFLARRHPNILFDAVDFSDSIDVAKQFSNNHGIYNISYYKEDFLTWNTDKTYDLVLSNGVLHHMPKYKQAVSKIHELATDKVVIGIYNKYGKLLKRVVKVQYSSDILYIDQEHCPFEVSFTDKEFKSLFDTFGIHKVYPSFQNKLVDFRNFFNAKNGGLTVYSMSLPK
jgi:ubiquinone/menaquinone biosynthesis C-methylase UbiE